MSKQNTLEHLVNKQFEIAGYDTTELNYQNLIKTKNKDWFTKNTITKEKQKEFELYAKSYLKKHVYNVEKEYNWFLFAYGLKCVDNE